MNRHAVNVLVILAAVLIYAALSLRSGTTSVNDGLGWEGPIYAAMVIDHDVQRGTAVHRLTAAFPLAAAIPFAATGRIVASFTVVNIVAFVLLVLAACLILDAFGTPLMVKLCTALTLAVLGLPAVTTAFNPGQPDLLAVALILFSVASCEGSNELPIVAAHVAAALASPIGIIAPLYGLWRRWRLRQRTPAALMVFVPALLAWTLLQVWARGGPRGLLELTRFSRVASDVGLWKESAFILFAVYFLITSLGGLTILLWSHPRWIAESVREKPELLALVLPVAVFIATGGLDLPRMIPFLIPFWLIVIAVWCRRQTTSLLIPVVMATVLTLLTQHPWSRTTNDSYFVDWFPYSVHAERVSVSDPDFSHTWRLRALIAAGGLAAFAAWRRRPVPIETA